MKNGNVKLSPVFATKEQEELFARCAKEAMEKTMSGEIKGLKIDYAGSKGKVILSPVFATKEQEELFSRCAKKSMFDHMADIEPIENGRQKSLN